jgi:NCAIR mutase (PurE)-related protein
MDAQKLQEIIKSISSGNLAPENAFDLLKTLTYENLEFAKLDTHRKLRQGIPEVIFGPGKTATQISQIAKTLMMHHQLVVATKVDPIIATEVLSLSPECNYDNTARMLIWGTMPSIDNESMVSVVTAGTADLPIAEEAALYLTASGVLVNRVTDVGVAGIHRLFPHIESLNKSAAVIIVAGMDGALPSVIGGLIATPIIAVPTSVGYGASFQGIAALLTMLTSCAAGITVVNIDNGFGAAVATLRILHSARKQLESD